MTGRGYYEESEGLLGLWWAFRAAGVGALVVSPWPLQDEWAQEWMIEYYQHLLLKGAPPGKAARLTSLAALTSRRDRHLAAPPIAWGAMMVGGR